MTQVVASTTEQDLLGGLLWTAGYTTASLAAGASEQIGISIGNRDVIYQARTYGGTASQVSVKLYQDTWSGGTPIPAANRNLRITASGPATYASGITGTPTTLRTGLNLYSAGVGQGSFRHKPGRGVVYVACKYQIYSGASKHRRNSRSH